LHLTTFIKEFYDDDDDDLKQTDSAYSICSVTEETTLGFISITRYRDIDRGFINLATLRHPEIERYHKGTHISRVHCSPVQAKHTY